MAPVVQSCCGDLRNGIYCKIDPPPITVNQGESNLWVAQPIVERLWSKLDALVDQRRSGMSPVMIEAILYLKENCDLWDISDVKTALKKLKENEKTARFEERWVALNQEQDRIMADMEALNPTGNDE